MKKVGTPKSKCLPKDTCMENFKQTKTIHCQKCKSMCQDKWIENSISSAARL